VGDRHLYGLTYGPDAERLLPALGKHKTGVACLYINKLQDVDRNVLAEMVRTGYHHVMAELHNP
jgi:Flp pilus assembly CpaF family ATPase